MRSGDRATLFRLFRPLAAAGTLVLGLWAGAALAADPAAAPQAPSEESPPRTLPDYDGRPAPGPDAGDVLLWVPRVVLFPLYFVTEVLIREPLGFLIAGAERNGVPAALYEFFTFGEQHQAGIVPTAFVSFDFQPSVGLYAFWNDAFFKGHDLRLRAGFGGRQWISAAVSERFYLDAERAHRLALEAALLQRPDYTYFGIGPDTRQSNLARYGQDLLEARVLYDQTGWRSNFLHAKVVLRSVDFRRGGYDGDPTLVEQVARGTFAPPPRAASGYEVLATELIAALDTREAPPASGSGLRVGAGGGYSLDLQERGGFVRYGAGVGAFWDLNQRQRVLSLTATTRFVDPAGGGVIPFTELVSLGGTEPMRGLYPGRLYDRSSAVLDLSYRWPIWIWLDGSIHSEFGNVFGPRLDGFRAGRLRWSGALGVESKGTPDSQFQLLIGVGTETFESGGKIDSLRIAAGATSGF
jgi:hypothetical protein